MYFNDGDPQSYDMSSGGGAGGGMAVGGMFGGKDK